VKLEKERQISIAIARGKKDHVFLKTVSGKRRKSGRPKKKRENDNCALSI